MKAKVCTVGVYSITSPSGKRYIGSSSNIEKRFKGYKSLWCKSQTRLYHSFLKYGVDAHNFEVVIECKTEELLQYEAIFGKLFDVLGKNGLNCRLPGINDTYPTISEKTKERIGMKNKGRKCSEETKAKQRIAHCNQTPTAFAVARCKEVNTMIILDTYTGVFYNGLREAAASLSMKPSTLRAKLAGQNRNDTPLTYT